MTLILCGPGPGKRVTIQAFWPEKAVNIPAAGVITPVPQAGPFSILNYLATGFH